MQKHTDVGPEPIVKDAADAGIRKDASELELVLDFSKWTYAELELYFAQIRRNSNLDVLFPLAKKVIVSSNWGVNLSADDPFGGLELEDSHAFLLVIGNKAGELVESLDALPTNLHWNTAQYAAWQAVIKRGDPTEIEKWLRAVVTFKTPVGTPINAIEGALGLRSVAEAYKKKVTGGR